MPLVGFDWHCFQQGGAKSAFLFTQRNQVARLQSLSRDLGSHNSQDTPQTHRFKGPKRAKQ